MINGEGLWSTDFHRAADPDSLFLLLFLFRSPFPFAMLGQVVKYQQDRMMKSPSTLHG